ncbi:PHB depolymerase family esterase [Alteromonas sp. ASW11-36]|uniref:PHB depolymerase family esterase n=1 Tax=Alteromonas arenosi TaxID=3055817 RepID=A0ABT7SUI3_9ALTE|nr:PHB depolymerase family esterase [Alteromonas sp. ASW11-36]MDM7859852.1 PHB depolymerase family esterase [Alteromonas sp. ASW11-36]
MRETKTKISVLPAMLGLSFAASAQLPPLSLDLSQTTVSGLSSGGYMATQFHLANSDWISGIGIIGTGPYYCAQGDIRKALSQCVATANPPIDNALLLEQAQQYSAAGDIPPLDNISDDRIWILHGLFDQTVNRSAADAVNEQYLTWTAPDNVEYIDDKPFGHHFPTLSNGSSCSASESPYIAACDYDAAGEMLNHLYSELNPPVEADERLFTVDQVALSGDSAMGLAEQGYVFIPKSCESESCRVHVSFHGCKQNAEAVGNSYAQMTGINQWANSNNIVVLYPQTKSSMLMPLNPHGCWDWWGYTGSDYATKDAVQIQAVVNMVNALNTRTE